MNIKTFGATAAIAMAFTAAPALAATIVLDSFTTEQYVGDRPATGEQVYLQTSTVTNASIYGGSRTMSAEAQVPSDIGATLATTLESKGGTLSFSNKAGVTGKGTLRYDFASLGGFANLSAQDDSTDPFFDFDVLSFDNGGNVVFSASAFDGENSITYSENISSGDFESELYFSAFTGAETFNFGNVDWVEFAITSLDTEISIDGQIGEITVNGIAPIPLPASGLLLLAGVGGMSLLRRRRKA